MSPDPIINAVGRAWSRDYSMFYFMFNHTVYSVLVKNLPVQKCIHKCSV